MTIFKIKSGKIEELFLFMTWFKNNELIKFQYGPIKDDDLHVLFFTLGLIKKSTFKRRLKDFSTIYQNSIVAEEINQDRFEINEAR
ncbi:hypothetical protein ACMDB5_13145 [Flavobacterium sp. W1B]|uniref:hypothetical protein n=1 Tax=Flavobacterium sp. W1B TaxID=3394146 RepID=UPI0039BC34F9